MDPLKGAGSSINGISNNQNGLKPQEKKQQDGAFEKLLDETIGKVASLQKEADQAIKELTSGEGDIVQAMIAMQKAEISFQTMVEVRNRLVSAYEEIMRMQV